MAVHIEEHLTPSRKAARWINWLLFFAATATLGLGTYGYFWLGPKGCPDHEPWWFFGWLYRTVALFAFAEANLHIADCHPYAALAAARFTGPSVIILAALRVAIQLLHDPFDRYRLRRLRGHTVVIGFGEQGRVRAHEAAGNGVRVVALDNAPDESGRAAARRDGIVLIEGDGCDSATLERTRLRRAKDFVVATGDDAQNLAIAQSIAAALGAPSSTERRIDVSLADPVIRRALDSSSADGVIEAFAVEEIAAFRLCRDVRFFEIADLLGQRRMHIVMIGFAHLGANLVAQILRSATTADLQATRFSIVSSDAGAAKDLLGLCYPGAEAVAEIRYFAADPSRVQIDRGSLMTDIDAGDPITAILLPGPRGADTLPAALAIREASRRTGRWQAPIFLGTEHAAALGSLARPIEATRRLSQVLQPFEISAHLCTRKTTEEREATARAIHETYRATMQDARHAAGTSAAREATVAWADLSPTYRQANRRAADHATAKLVSAGCVVPPGPPSVPAHFDLLQEAGMLERLAALEHRAWAIDRQLDGWRPGNVRDNSRLVHDCLKPYEQLNEAAKELDREQIRDLATRRLARVSDTARVAARMVRFDLWLGVVGTPSINRTEASWLKETLSAAVLAPLLAAHPEHNITLVSPLSPGGDLIATQVALAYLAAQKRQYRLLVVEGLRDRLAIDDFESHWVSGSAGAVDPASDGAAWKQARSALEKTIEAIEAAPTCERVVELDPVGPGATAEQRQAASSRQSAYLVQRTHVLVAAIKQPMPMRPGGVGEAITWRRDRSTMPQTIPRYPRRPNNAADGTPGLIIIDVGQQKVRDEPSGF